MDSGIVQYIRDEYSGRVVKSYRELIIFLCARVTS